MFKSKLVYFVTSDEKLNVSVHVVVACLIRLCRSEERQNRCRPKAHVFFTPSYRNKLPKLRNRGGLKNKWALGLLEKRLRILT